MAEETEVKVNLTAEDNASAVLRRFQNQLNKFNNRLRNSPLLTPKPAETKQLQRWNEQAARKLHSIQIGGARELNQAVQRGFKAGKRMRQEERKDFEEIFSFRTRMGRQQASEERKRFNSNVAAHGQLMRLQLSGIKALHQAVDRGTKAGQKRQQDVHNADIRAMIQKAQAGVKNINDEHKLKEQKLREEQKMRDRIWSQNQRRIRDEAALRERVQRDLHAQRGRDRRSGGRQAWRGGVGAIRSGANAFDGNFFNSPFFYSMMAGGAAAAGGRKAISTEVDIDTAEMNARIFGKLDAQQARSLRSDWAAPLSEELGIATSNMLTAYTEALKVGIKEEGARSFAKLSTQASAAFGVDMDSTNEILGIINTLVNERGTSVDQGNKNLRGVVNSMTLLSDRMATTPQKMISFLQRGAGAAELLGMSMDKAMAIGAAATSLGIQASSSGRMFDFVAGRITELPQIAKGRGQDARKANELARKLGYGSATNLSNKIQKAPDTEIFEFFNSFNKIKNPRERAEAIRFFAGQEWLGEFGRIVKNPDRLKEAQDIAAESARLSTNESSDPLSHRWEMEQMKLQVSLSRMKVGFENMFAEIGMTLSPMVKDFSQEFMSKVKELRGSGYIRQSSDSFFRGLIEGFLGRSGSIKDLMKGLTGGNLPKASSFFDFAKGFAEGLKEVWTGVKTFLAPIAAAMGIDTSTAKGMGEFVAKLIGLSMAVHFLRPVVSIFTGLIGVFGGLTTASVGLWRVLKAFGIVGGATAGGASLMARIFGSHNGKAGIIQNGGALLAGLLPSISRAFWSTAKGIFTKGLWFGVGLWIAEGILEYVMGNNRAGYEAKGYDYDKIKDRGVLDLMKDIFASDEEFRKKYKLQPGAKDPVSSLMESLTGGSGSEDLKGGAGADSLLGSTGDDLVRSVDDLNGTMQKIEQRARLASLDVTSTGSIGGVGGLTGGGAVGGGSGDPAKHFGSNFYTPGGLSVPSWHGGTGASGAQADRMKSVYSAFKSAGLSDEAAKSFTAEIGRENDFNANLMYGSHVDPHNGARNAGMMSWQKERATALLEHLGRGGHLNPDGSIKRTQEALNAQAQFAIQEMESGALGEKGKQALAVLRDPNSTHAQRALALGDDVIKWRQHDPRYAHHKAKRDGYYNQLGSMASGPQSASLGDPAAVAGSGGISLNGIPVKGAQATAGGGHHSGLSALAQELTAGGVAGGLNRFTAFNDKYHLGRRSKHNQGLATDFTINDARFAAQAAEDVRKKFRAAGLTDKDFKVIDEYNNPSKHSTGGHIHAQFSTQAAAEKYKAFIEAQRAQAPAGVANGAPTPASMSQAIPTPPAPAAAAGGGGGGGGMGPVTVNVHGAGDPEQVAAAVERRINEKMKWRTHDMETNIG